MLKVKGRPVARLRGAWLAGSERRAGRLERAPRGWKLDGLVPTVPRFPTGVRYGRPRRRRRGRMRCRVHPEAEFPAFHGARGGVA